MITALFIGMTLLLAWATRHHARRRRLWITETALMAILWALVVDAKWGKRPDPRPWRIYVDSSASMSWAGRYALAKNLAGASGGDIVYFDTQVHDNDTGPIGTGTDYECVMADWRTQKEAYQGLILLSDGCAPPAKTLTAPVNAVWMNQTETVEALRLEVPAEATVGDEVKIETDPGAAVWVLGGQSPTQDGRAVWRPEAPSLVSVFARKGRSVVEKHVHVYSRDTPYVLRIVVGVDPAIPLAREQLGGLRIEPLQWNGKSWRWQDKTYRTTNLSLWIGNAQWLWLDTASWNRLPSEAREEIWSLWDKNTVGLYWDDNAVPLPPPWNAVMPGTRDAARSWGFKDPEWGPQTWTSSAALKDLSTGAQSLGAGLALHSMGRHRIALHTGTDWQIGLTEDTRPFWSHLSQWLIDGNRPVVSIAAEAPHLNGASRIDLQVRDRHPKQLRVVAETIDHEGTRVVPVTPRSLQDWTGSWTPTKPGLYRITVFGSGEAGAWSAETIANVPGETDEILQGQVPDNSSLTSMAVNSGGSFQVGTMDPKRWIGAGTDPSPRDARDYPWLLGIAGALVLVSAHTRLNYRYFA
jgi:hypothetical protein